MPVDLVLDDDLVDLPLLDIRMLGDWLDRVAAVTDDERARWDVCVRLCGETVSGELNQRFRGRTGPTNVLSFAAEISLPDAKVLGDLAICWPVVLREAQEQGKDPAHHLAHLCVHGALHLLGCDHETSAEARHMERLEVEILGGLGIANPYA